LRELDRWHQGSVDGVLGHSIDSGQIVDLPETVREVPNCAARLLLRRDSDDRCVLCAQPDADQPALDHEVGLTDDVLIEMKPPLELLDFADHYAEVPPLSSRRLQEMGQLALEIAGRRILALNRDR
jgi:hypothetical protein